MEFSKITVYDYSKMQGVQEYTIMFEKIKLLAAATMVILAVSSSVPAKASPVVTDEKTLILQDMLRKEFGWYKTYAKIAGYELKSKKEIYVTNEEDFYSAVIPDVTITLLNTNKILHIGNIAVNFAQRNNDVWDAKVAIPNLITLNNIKDKIESNIRIGSQECGFSWVPSKKVYPQIQATFGDIEISNRGNKLAKIYIKEADVHSFLNVNVTNNWAGYNKNHTWKGQTSFGIKDLSITLDKNFSIDIDNIRNTTYFRQLSPLRIASNRITVKDEIADSSDGIKNNDATMVQRFAKLLPTDKESVNGFDISGVHIRKILHKGKKETDSIKLNIASLDNTFIGIKNGLFNMRGNMKFQGFEMTGFVREFDRLFPKSGAIAFESRNIPIKSLEKVLVDNLSAIMDKNGKDVFNRTGPKITNLLKDNRSYLYVRKSHLQNKDTNIRFSGNFTANPSAVYGLTANLNVAFDGLNDPQKTFQAFGEKPNIDMKTLAYAINMAAIATSKNSSGDGTIDNYKVKIYEDGAVEVNGRGFHSN